MKFTCKFTILICLILLSSTAWCRLTEQEYRELSSKPIFKTYQDDNSKWPSVTIDILVDVSPIEAIAIYSAYEDQQKYVPNMVSSKISQIKMKNDILVDYEMRIPWPFSNSKYTTGNVIEKLNNKSYVLRWYFVKSTHTKNNYGQVIFSPYQNKTLLHYENHTLPDTTFASFLVGTYKSGVLKTVEAIASHMNTMKQKDPQTLEKYVSKTKEILGMIDDAVANTSK